MAHVITDACVSCGTCAGECPVNAISEGDGKYVIDADACIDCGTCAAACPTGAIEALFSYIKDHCICQKADAQWSFFVKEDSYDTCKTHHRYHTFTQYRK